MTRTRWVAVSIFVAAFCYYAFLSSKTYTFAFASGDAGDWLAASTWWIVPQPPGSPLYITLGHLLSALPGDLVVKMTIILSALPATITVAVVFLIVKRRTEHTWAAVTASLVVLGATIFLSQAIVLEEYALATMFLTLALYAHTEHRTGLTALFLGLGTAVHVTVLAVAVLWWIVSGRNEARRTAKYIPILVISGILPYALILWLMASDAPPLIAGYGLSLTVLREYLGTSSVAGTLTIVDFPVRLYDAVSVISVSFCAAAVPAVLWLVKKGEGLRKFVLAGVAFFLWYYLTSQDPTTWTYLTMVTPLVAVAAGEGTLLLSPHLRRILIAWLLVVVVINGIALNQWNGAEQWAAKAYDNVAELPSRSAVITERGGSSAFTAFYAMTQGKDIVPIFVGDSVSSESYRNYTTWLRDRYGLVGSNDRDLIRAAGAQERTLYLQIERWEYLDGLGLAPVFDTSPVGSIFAEVVIR